MKKVILGAAALLFGAIGFAQVQDADGNWSPTATVISPLPDSGPGANAGLSIQNGNANKVRVRQAGTSQSVYTHQDDGSGTGGNDALVRQTGAVSASSGVANEADVRQSGTANDSRTIQEGDYNEAVTRQGQNNDASSGNNAWIQQGTGQQAENNYAAIDQDGADNEATTVQIHDNSDAWTQQTGEGNMSRINQNGAPNGSDGHYAMNQQEGDRNSTLINQSGAGARNAARTLQIGADNKAQQTQVATDASGGTGNDAGIVQGLRAGGTFQPYVLTAQEAFTQRGHVLNNVDNGGLWMLGNTANSIGAKAKQDQVGSDNSAGIFQFGGTLTASNHAEQDQQGDANNAGIAQSFVGPASNYARQEQLGSENSAGMVQEGSGHKSLQAQNGNLNISWAYQVGECNQLNTHQFGDENVAYSTQRGTENATLIVQHDGQSYSVQQNKDLAEFTAEGGNQADILQMGPDGDFGAGAVDCYFDDPMEIGMPTPMPELNLEDICPDCD